MHKGTSIGDSPDDPFRKGAQVEVSFEDEGFRGSWYTATVIKPPPKKKSSKKPRIFLEFHTLAASSTISPLRESVDLVLVRPIPPRDSKSSFHVGDDVDAFHNDGWWEGIVITVFEGGRRYSVYFRSSREQIDFPESQLRLHREWFYGKWVPALENEVKNGDVDHR